MQTEQSRVIPRQTQSPMATEIRQQLDLKPPTLVDKNTWILNKSNRKENKSEVLGTIYSLQTGVLGVVNYFV